MIFQTHLLLFHHHIHELSVLYVDTVLASNYEILIWLSHSIAYPYVEMDVSGNTSVNGPLLVKLSLPVVHAHIFFCPK